MSAGFPVEDFLQAITSQLDRAQDALRLKSVNRPLTYAIRDFSMDLKVFVELGQDGRVVFRSSEADDTGASVVHIGFTTVNRTMIEENTVSLSAVKGPTLDELGLDEQERRQLEVLGVRNASQLDRLKDATGESTVARYSGLPVSRLRQALANGRPVIQTVRPVPSPSSPRPVGGEPHGPLEREPHRTVWSAPVPDQPAEPLRVPGGTRKLLVGGPRMGESGLRARLDGRELTVREAEDGIEVDLGDDASDGDLELETESGPAVSMALEFEPLPLKGGGHDPWRSA